MVPITTCSRSGRPCPLTCRMDDCLSKPSTPRSGVCRCRGVNGSVDPAPANPGLPHFDLPDIGGWNFKQVAIDDDKVGPLAGLKRADDFFLMLGKGGVQCKGAKGLEPRHGLRHVPTAWRPVGMVGSRDRRVQTEEWVGRFHGEIRTTRDART